MLIPPYYLKNNYAYGVPVSPQDLNRRADVIGSQLPGAFRAFGEGVFGLSDLLVNTPTTGQISSGDALILNADGALVYVSVPQDLAIPTRDDELYLHLALRVPDEIGGIGDTSGTDSRRGAPPVLLLSENEEETDALLLASWNGTAWVDERTFSASAQLQQIQADVGYDETERAKGSLAERLNALGEPADGVDGPTTAQFNSLKLTVESQGDRLDEIEARLANIESRDADDFPSLEDQLADEIAINRAGLAEVNPSAIERGQISVVVANAGHGQNSTVDFTPTTGDANELSFNIVDGTFGT